MSERPPRRENSGPAEIPRIDPNDPSFSLEPTPEMKSKAIEKSEALKALDEERNQRELSAVADNFVEQARQLKPDFLVFLDGSARKYAPLLTGRWKARYPDDDIPQTKFVNFGREKKGMTFEELKPMWEEVREAFSVKNSKEGATIFDEKNLLIVDEIIETGGSVRGAMTFMAAAFNKAARIDQAGLTGENLKGLAVKPLSSATEDLYKTLHSEGIRPSSSDRYDDIFIRPDTPEGIEGVWFEEHKQDLIDLSERVRQATGEFEIAKILADHFISNKEKYMEKVHNEDPSNWKSKTCLSCQGIYHDVIEKGYPKLGVIVNELEKGTEVLENPAVRRFYLEEYIPIFLSVIQRRAAGIRSKRARAGVYAVMRKKMQDIGANPQKYEST